MKRSEVLFTAFCAASGLMAGLAVFGVVSLAGTLPMGLYPLYSVAAFSGWISGNLYVARRRAAAAHPVLLLAVYLIGPAGPLSLVRSMADAESLVRAPGVPLFAFGVYLILFLVPITLRKVAPARPGVTLGRDKDSKSSAGDAR